MDFGWTNWQINEFLVSKLNQRQFLPFHIIHVNSTSINLDHTTYNGTNHIIVIHTCDRGFYFSIGGKLSVIWCYTWFWLRTSSNSADINRFWSQTGKCINLGDKFPKSYICLCIYVNAIRKPIFDKASCYINLICICT